MQSISATEACHRLPSLLDQASRDREPIAITRDGSEAVILLAAEEFAAMEETLHLLSTPANADQLRQGLNDYAAGKRISGGLCD